MPTLTLTVPRGAWSKEQKAKIVDRLTNTLNDVATEEGKGDIKAFIGVQVTETAEGGYAVGGRIFG